MGNYLKENNIKVKDGTNVNFIMRNMMSIILKGILDQEMDEELGYSKYDYLNKETDNSRNGLKNRGVEDILITCIDGLTDFPQAIEAVFPETEIQLCIIRIQQSLFLTK